MPLGSTPCFPCVPGVGRQLKVQAETHSTHALHGKSSEIKGFVCTTNNKDCSQFTTCQRRTMIHFLFCSLSLFLNGDFCSRRGCDFRVKGKRWITCFAFVHLALQ